MYKLNNYCIDRHYNSITCSHIAYMYTVRLRVIMTNIIDFYMLVHVFPLFYFLPSLLECSTIDIRVGGESIWKHCIVL